MTAGYELWPARPREDGCISETCNGITCKHSLTSVVLSVRELCALSHLARWVLCNDYILQCFYNSQLAPGGPALLLDWKFIYRKAHSALTSSRQPSCFFVFPKECVLATNSQISGRQ